MEEIWKDVVGFEGLYQVSSLGRIKSLDRYILKKNGVTEFKRGKMMTLIHNKQNNVYEVSLSKQGHRKCRKIHRIVAEAFIHNDNPEEKTTVNHIDGKRENNRVDNLEWSTYYLSPLILIYTFHTQRDVLLPSVCFHYYTRHHGTTVINP